MNDVMIKTPEDHPVILAWREHQTTDDFANSYKLAAHPKHLQDSLWTEAPMIEEPKQKYIDAAFQGCNFGAAGETPEGRKNLVAHCILKRACGFSDGSTIEAICKELGLLTKQGNPKKWAKMWAYCHIAR